MDDLETRVQSILNTAASLQSIASSLMGVASALLADIQQAKMGQQTLWGDQIPDVVGNVTYLGGDMRNHPSAT